MEWSSFVRDYSKKNNCSYKEALTLARDDYYKTKGNKKAPPVVKRKVVKPKMNEEVCYEQILQKEPLSIKEKKVTKPMTKKDKSLTFTSPAPEMKDVKKSTQKQSKPRKNVSVQ